MCVVGAPVMSPEELIVRPGGRPVAVKVSAKPPESVAAICKLTFLPTLSLCWWGFVTVTVLVPLELTVQVKEVEPLAPVESLAVTVTEDEPAVVGEPLMRPEELIDKPAGRPLAVKVSEAPPESVAAICKLTAEPTVVVCVPGLVTVTVLPVLPPPQSVAGRVLPIGVPRPEAMS